MEIIKELKDLTYLEWTRTRHSSGSAGSFLKAYEIKNGKKYYYKLSNYDPVYGITGHESVNELIADRLLTVLNIEHLDYTLIHAKISIKGSVYETYLCRSEDFKEKGDFKTALDAYYDMEAENGESPYDFCRRMGFEEYIDKMLVFDFLIINRDRHGANIELIRNKDREGLHPAPLFDHGLSMILDKSMKPEDFKPLDDKKVQCFVGTSSTFENLKLIPKEKLIKLPEFNDELFNFIFSDISEILGDDLAKMTYKLLKERAKAYEDFCNSQC